ncbi:MAG: insulinase family protein [Bacteroidales bacterium]|nr:insulinase family protein [Bacteroidales bacterium]
MNIYTHTLENGLRVIHRQFPSEISYCGVAINTGTRDEYSHEWGMAHFVEHMLFKGTKRRKAHHISNRMENVGGDLNAFTTKEETFIYSTFLKEYFPRAVELLGDIIFNSEFPQIQINREREVVLDEIDSYDDNPSELIYDDFENLIFSGHDIGHYILGELHTLNSFNSDNVNSFVKRQYQTSEMVFFSFGKTPFSKVLKLTEKYFNIKQEPVEAKNRVAPIITTPVTRIIDKNTTQTHVVLGWNKYNMYHPDRYVVYLLNSILGGGSLNSRLSRSLREKNGLVYNIESNITFYSDTGFYSIYFACDPKNKDKCLRLIKKELKSIMEKALTPMQLTVAKRQWKGQLGISAEMNENNALSMAKNYLHHKRFIDLEEVFSKVDAISAEQIKSVANELFSSEPFELIYK